MGGYHYCLESLPINIFSEELIIMEVLSTICIISSELPVKISLGNVGQFEKFVVQNMCFRPPWLVVCFCG